MFSFTQQKFILVALRRRTNCVFSCFPFCNVAADVSKNCNAMPVAQHAVLDVRWIHEQPVTIALQWLKQSLSRQ